MDRWTILAVNVLTLQHSGILLSVHMPLQPVRLLLTPDCLCQHAAVLQLPAMMAAGVMAACLQQLTVRIHRARLG